MLIIQLALACKAKSNIVSQVTGDNCIMCMQLRRGIGTMGDKIHETVQMCDVECENKNGWVDAAWMMNECDTAKEIGSDNNGNV